MEPKGPSRLLSDPSIRSVAVVRLRIGLGDLLASVPALRALRAYRPDVHIAMVTWAEVSHIIERQTSYVDELIPFPGHPGIPERDPDMAGWSPFVTMMHDRGFDVAIQAYGGQPAANRVVASLGARCSAGFYTPGAVAVDPLTHLPYPDHLPEVQRHLALFRFLGVPGGDPGLEFPVTEPDRREADGLRDSVGTAPGRYVCVHPGATAPSRRWLPERFAAVADGLARRGWDVLITGSQGEEAITALVAGQAHSPVIDVSGMTSLGGLAALLSTARVLVTNDSGPAHLAAALGVPTVTVFQAGEPARWAPPDRSRHVPVEAGVSCQPCSHQECPIDFRCATSIAVGEVLRPALRLLRERA